MRLCRFRSKNNNHLTFISIIFLTEIVLFILSRLLVDDQFAFYTRAPINFLSTVGFISYLLIIPLIMHLFASSIPILRAAQIRMSTFNWLVVASCMLLTLKWIIIASDARYTGGLTGLNGLINGLSYSTFMFIVVVASRMRRRNIAPHSLPMLVLFFCAGLSLDGFSSALTLLASIYLVFFCGRRNTVSIYFFAVASIFLLTLGLLTKYNNGIPAYFTPQYASIWALSRFSIQAEQLYSFFAGKLSIQNFWDTSGLILRSIGMRFDLVLTGQYENIFPRSVSEAIHFDMKGYYHSGSSPGLSLGLLLLGPFSIPVVILLFVFLRQYFRGSTRPLTLIEIIFLSFIFKGIYSDITEHFTIISPTLLYSVCMFLGTFVEPYKANLYLPSKTGIDTRSDENAFKLLRKF